MPCTNDEKNIGLPLVVLLRYPDETARRLPFVGKARMSLRTAVNFDQGNPNEITLQHLDPAPDQTPGGFEVGVKNVELVGSRMVDNIVANWRVWQKGVPNITQ